MCYNVIANDGDEGENMSNKEIKKFAQAGAKIFAKLGEAITAQRALAKEGIDTALFMVAGGVEVRAA